jgi:hypothetical protein
VPQPYVIDAKGEKYPALLQWENSKRELSVALSSARELVYPVLLDPAFETEVWVELQYPPPSANHQQVYDPIRKRTIVFGGNIPFNETWSWDGISWRKKVSKRGSPDVPVGGVGLWSEATQRIIAIGEQGEIVSWDGAEWRRELGCTFATTLQKFAALEDPISGQVVIAGGYRQANGTYPAEAYAWTAAGGCMQTPSGAAAPARAFGNMLWDPVRKSIVYFGGSGPGGTDTRATWRWSAGIWSIVAGAAPFEAGSGAAAAWDPERQNIVTFGGSTTSTPNDTWLWDGLTWTRAAPATRPAPRRYASMAWDPAQKQLVLLGGEFDISSALDGVWHWNGANWSRAQQTPVPFGRVGGSMAWDPASGKLLLFGGVRSSIPLNDTWLWDGAKWAVGGSPQTPQARFAPTATYQPVEKPLTSSFGRRYCAIFVGLGTRNAKFLGLARLDITVAALQNTSARVLQQAAMTQSAKTSS